MTTAGEANSKPDLDRLEGLLFDMFGDAQPDVHQSHSIPHVVHDDDHQDFAECQGVADSELVAAAVNALPTLIASARERDVLAGQVEAARGLHTREHYEGERDWCWHDLRDWPCPTIKALNSAGWGV